MKELTTFDKISQTIITALAIIFSVGSIILSFVVCTTDEYNKQIFNENWLFLLFGISILLTLMSAYVESNNRNKYRP